jgi:hypothetical protein
VKECPYPDLFSPRTLECDEFNNNDATTSDLVAGLRQVWNIWQKILNIPKKRDLQEHDYIIVFKRKFHWIYILVFKSLGWIDINTSTLVHTEAILTKPVLKNCTECFFNFPTKIL